MIRDDIFCQIKTKTKEDCERGTYEKGIDLWPYLIEVKNGRSVESKEFFNKKIHEKT